MRRALVVLGGLLVVAVIGAGVYLDGVAPVATGYAARIGCGIVALQDRPIDDVRPELPSNPLVPYLDIDELEDGVEVDLFGLWSSTVRLGTFGGCQPVPADVTSRAERESPIEVDPRSDDLTVPGTPAATDSAARRQGFDPVGLAEALDASFAEADDDPLTNRGTRAVLVVHDGVVIAERYAEGFTADTPLIGWSMTKSIADAMAGRLVQQGELDLDATELRPTLGWTGDDPRAAITLDDLLRMSSGLEFEEVYDVGTDATVSLFTETDAGEFAADKPLVADPGTRWSYSSGTTNVICDVLADEYPGTAAGMARDLIFEPLQMASATIGTDVNGDPVCSSYGYATARDWARFGLLYAQDGMWAGERLLPPGWVRTSTTPTDAETYDAAPGETVGYGRQWWLNRGADGTVSYDPLVPLDTFYASGHEGQRVAVLPSDDVIIVRLGLAVGLEGVGWGFEELVTGVLDARDGGA